MRIKSSKKLHIGVAIPAYNEESLIQKTLLSVPNFVETIVVVNDGSSDATLKKINFLKKNDPRITVINNEQNMGIGYSLKAAIKRAVELGADRVAVLAGDAQMDTKHLLPMLEQMDRDGLDFIKANRFMHLEALKKMPLYRRLGNIIVTILTKFATGYYSIFDTQNGYVIYSKGIVERMPWGIVGNRYEYENTILIGLAIINAKIGDYPAPAIYGDEKSTIKIFSTTFRVLKILFIGFWQRIYYKYIVYGFHPIALFLLCGVISVVTGGLFGLWILITKIFYEVTPTSGTVMLVALPLMLGLQMLLTALVLDVIEDK